MSILNSEGQATKALVEKWSPVIDHDAFGSVIDQTKRRHLAIVLENQERAAMESGSMLMEAGPGNQTGGPLSGNTGAGIAKYDPVLISLVRRTMPKLIAYDICGVQPLTQPTGLVFAMRTRYDTQSGAEAFYNEADSGKSGTGTQAGQVTDQASIGGAGTAFTNGTGIDTASGEALGDVAGGAAAFAKMGFTIEKVVCTAKTRAMAADYSTELAQDLKALHGLDAEAELSNILATEILAEQNREILRAMYVTAKPGCVSGSTVTAGVFDLDTDSNGRWSQERFLGLGFQINREANVIAQQTRRGKGNFMIVSADVASALAMSGKLQYAPVNSTEKIGTVDEGAGATYVGTFDGMKVYIDPYVGNANASSQFVLIGYKGANVYDAGLYFSPYVPLQMVKTIDPNTFQPKFAFKTRYALTANPFAEGTTQGQGALTANANVYFRKFSVRNLV